MKVIFDIPDDKIREMYRLAADVIMKGMEHSLDFAVDNAISHGSIIMHEISDHEEYESILNSVAMMAIGQIAGNACRHDENIN